MSLVRQAHGKDVTFSMPEIWRMLAEKQTQVPINALIGEVLLYISGNATNQDLASQNVPTSLLTQNNFRFARNSTRIRPERSSWAVPPDFKNEAAGVPWPDIISSRCEL